MVSYIAASPWGFKRMVWPTILALLVRLPVSSPILNMVYSSFLCEGLKPSISGIARETITLMA